MVRQFIVFICTTICFSSCYFSNPDSCRSSIQETVENLKNSNISQSDAIQFEYSFSNDTLYLHTTIPEEYHFEELYRDYYEVYQNWLTFNMLMATTFPAIKNNFFIPLCKIRGVECNRFTYKDKTYEWIVNAEARNKMLERIYNNPSSLRDIVESMDSIRIKRLLPSNDKAKEEYVNIIAKAFDIEDSSIKLNTSQEREDRNLCFEVETTNMQFAEIIANSMDQEFVEKEIVSEIMGWLSATRSQMTLYALAETDYKIIITNRNTQQQVTINLPYTMLAKKMRLPERIKEF